MPQTPRLKWPIPEKDRDPWFEDISSLMGEVDATAFAAMEDRNLFLMGGGTVTWNAGSGVVSWTTALEIRSPFTGLLHTAAAGNATLVDGAFLYVSLTRYLTSAVVLTPTTAVSFPPGQSLEDYCLLCVRRGTKLYWRNGDVFSSGDSRELGVGSGGGGGGSSLNAQAFRYTCSGGEGTDFTVTLPVARDSDTYAISAGLGSVNAFFMIAFPDSVAGDRTTSQFRVLTSAAVAAGDQIDFIVMDR